jgi:hypothetical protein
MKNLRESFKKRFTQDIPIEIEDDYPTHVPIKEMIEIVAAASQKIGMDRYAVLKHFKFTEEEIRDHFHDCRVSHTRQRKGHK